MIGGRCKICGKVYKYHKRAIQHMMKHKVEPTEEAIEALIERWDTEASIPLSMVDTSDVAAEIDHNRPYKCGKCGFIAKNYTAIKHHLSGTSMTDISGRRIELRRSHATRSHLMHKYIIPVEPLSVESSTMIMNKAIEIEAILDEVGDDSHVAEIMARIVEAVFGNDPHGYNTTLPIQDAIRRLPRA